MSAHVLPSLAVNSKSEQKGNSLPPLRFEPVNFGMLAHLSDHSAKSYPLCLFYFGYLYSAYPRVSSKRFTFTHTTGCATWVTLESRLHNSGAHDQSLPVSFSRAPFSSLFFFFLHSFFTKNVHNIIANSFTYLC
jgi:hypothetical protein